MEEANISGDGRETRGDDPFQNLGNGLEENIDAERGRRIVGRFPRLVQDHPVRHFH